MVPDAIIKLHLFPYALMINHLRNSLVSQPKVVSVAHKNPPYEVEDTHWEQKLINAVSVGHHDHNSYKSEHKRYHHSGIHDAVAVDQRPIRLLLLGVPEIRERERY